MMMAGGLGGALLLLTAQAPAPLPLQTPPPAVAAQQIFAPPVDQAMNYRVTTRRLGRDGALISFSLVCALQWQRAGRGYALAATLQRIESDAPPQVVRLLTAALQPLVGETLTYHVTPDGRSIEMLDPDGLWERVADKTQSLAAEAGQEEARQVAQILAALSVEERRQLASADIDALVAPANPDIMVAGLAPGASISVKLDAMVRTVTKTERATLPVGGDARPLEIDSLWAIDTATGLVLREQRQSWIAGADGKARTLVEERIRALEPVKE